MQNRKYNILTVLLIATLAISSCKKFLELKPNKQLTVPATLTDYQSLLDNNSMLSDEPSAGEISTDDYYNTTDSYLSLNSDALRRTYTWEKDYLFEPQLNDWSFFSTAVYYCNTVLEGTEKIERTTENAVTYDNVRGQAYFLRAKRFLQASFVWMQAYDKESASAQLGLPLRLTPDFNIPSVRATMEETYKQIIFDAVRAIPLLPIKPLSVTRSSKPAAYALMARIYLAMRDYERAGLYADSSLRLNGDLLDYNELNPATAFPIPRFNVEVLSETGMGGGQLMNMTRLKVSPALYTLFDSPNDLRRAIFFTPNADGSYAFKGRFIVESFFSGMATNEMYLIRAESNARRGNVAETLNDLNALLVKRWKRGSFQPLTANDAQEALRLVLLERRRDLLFRGLRWIDIKRLNKEGAGIVMTRSINNKTYTLLPNDLRYALPIPEDVIALSGMSQNPR